MNDQLESDLRTALRARAGEVPAAAVGRLTGIDYRPRTRGLRPPVAIGALASAGAAAGTLAVVISLGAGASNAFAGWTAKPTAAAPGQIADARASCEASQSPIAGLPLKLADTRGPFTFSIYADDNSSATCIQGPSFTAASGSMSSYPLNVPAGHVLLSNSHATDRDGAAYSLAEGRTGSDVTGVTLTLDDGTSVQATVGNGWFIAWWPGSHDVKSAQLTTPSGVTNQTFPSLPAVPGGDGAGGDGAGSGPHRSSGSSSSFGPGAGQGATHDRVQGFSTSQ
jgi:hypothetical protein